VTQTASTVQQVVLLILFVLPGITYQFVRERARGPVAGERELGERVLRAITASIALDAVYLMVAAPWLVDLVKPVRQQWFANALAYPRRGGRVRAVSRPSGHRRVWCGELPAPSRRNAV
jgi:hypothetical protein